MKVSATQRENINRAKRDFYQRNKDDKEYKEHRKYINLRSYSKNFILKYATQGDLETLRGLINNMEDKFKSKK